jgi:hypothetical protein
MTDGAPRVTRRTLIAAAIAVPAVVAAIGLTAIEAYRAVRPTAPLFGVAPASLADAITGGYGVEYAYRFIRSGQDPDEPIVVDDPDYTDGRMVNVSPLMLAIAARDENTALMLLNVGARLDLPQNRWAWCLAQEVGTQALRGIIDRYGGADLPRTCPDRPSGAGSPLLRWLD